MKADYIQINGQYVSRGKFESMVKRGEFTAKDTAMAVTLGKPKATRLRQSSKPLLNKLENEWFNIIKDKYPNYPAVRPQAKRYKIGNGAWYKPDLTASSWPTDNGPAKETAWECKGPSQMKNVARGILTIKAAAHQWPEVRFILCWKENGQWKQQEILP